ncbi:hypothetical protein Tco_1127875, partial [Tanacetum coccineum]
MDYRNSMIRGGATGESGKGGEKDRRTRRGRRTVGDACEGRIKNAGERGEKSALWDSTAAFIYLGNACPLTRITTTTEAPLRKPIVLDNETSKPAVTLVYLRSSNLSSGIWGLLADPCISTRDALAHQFRLVPNPPPSTPPLPPSQTKWDILFQPMFDELLTPPPSVDLQAPKVIAPVVEVIAPVPVVSTETQPSVIPNDVEEDNHDIEVAHMGNDPYFGVPIPEVPSDQSSSSDSIHTIMQPVHQIFEHNSKWTKDHPLENIISELARPVSTRLQLHEQALFCYYDAFLTAVEPKTYKDA